MLSLANIDIVETLSWFRSKGFKVSFLVPTETSLVKSIMDATQDFREFLSSQNLHIYEDQKQGTENKRLIETIFISRNQIYETQTSLYRPQTKDGDPRLWIYGLKKHSKSGDLLAVLISENRLVVINCSNSNLNELEIWTYFLENELFYNTDIDLRSRFLSLSPYSKFNLDIDRLSPGNIGGWLGYKIVSSYVNKNNISLDELINLDHYTIFKNSKYKPPKK